MIREQGVAVYIFDEADGTRGEERLWRAAEHYCGIADRELLQVKKTPLGKPYFPLCQALHFSISHSGNYWVCAFSHGEVGVDIQEHVLAGNETRQEAAQRFCRMAHRFFHPVEAQYVEKESFYRFFGVWAARESYVKYTGQGIDASFSEHCVIPMEAQLWSVSSSTSPKEEALRWHAQGVWFWETIFRENYTLCLCTEQQQLCEIVTNIL